MEAYFTRVANIIVRRLEELDASASTEERITAMNAALSIVTMEKSELAAQRQMEFQLKLANPAPQAAAPGFFFGAKVTDLNGKEMSLEELPAHVKEFLQQFQNAPPSSSDSA